MENILQTGLSLLKDATEASAPYFLYLFIIYSLYNQSIRLINIL